MDFAVLLLVVVFAVDEAFLFMVFDSLVAVAAGLFLLFVMIVLFLKCCWCGWPSGSSSATASVGAAGHAVR